MLKTFKSLFSLLMLFIMVLSVNSCGEENLESTLTEPSEKGHPKTKGGFNEGYFDWYNVEYIEMVIPSGKVKIGVPWKSGASNNSALPDHWIDLNYNSSKVAERMYSKDNGWELVYSNVYESSDKKYFALYNKYMGKLRFFMYAYATSSGSGTSSAFWGLRADKGTSLFNFTESIAKPRSDVQPTPVYIESTPVAFNNGKITVNNGYQENQWYGFELECAYDPQMPAGANFKIFGRAVTSMKTTGTATTTGSIDGIITGGLGSSGVNVTVKDILNKSNKTEIKQESSTAINQTTMIIENGIKSNNKFYKDLYSDIQAQSSSLIGGSTGGVKGTLEKIISAGSPKALKLVSGLFSSLLGNSSKPNTNKIELTLNTKTQIEVTSETVLMGYGGISSFPIAGSPAGTDRPFYDKPLGVWTLSKTPGITARRYVNWGNSFSDYDYDYFINHDIRSLILLNPEVVKDFNISGISYTILSEKYNNIPFFNDGDRINMATRFEPYAVINGKEYYNLGSSVGVSGVEITGGSPPYLPWKGKITDLLVKVSFDLVHKQTNDVYHHYKYFYPEITDVEDLGDN